MTQLDVGTNRLFFVYDGTSPTAVVFNNTTYYYVTNLQGDIIAILNGSGAKVVEYTYDAWGNILSTTGSMASTLGVLNPLRYRGYVYDTETGLYYLQSRYYNPAMGRFINADAFSSTGQGLLGNNMFAYCGNNPVMGYDPSGLINWGGVMAGVGLGLLAAGAIALTIVTAGAASPLAATILTTAGTVVSAALLESSIVTTTGAIREDTVVYDINVTGGYDRAGCSYVYDFEEDTSEWYLHAGKQSKIELGVTFGTGFVYNYSGEGRYGGEFVDVSTSVDYKGASLGLDYCTSPSNLTNGYKDSHAILFTSGWSATFSQSKLPTVAYDYYWPIS